MDPVAVALVLAFGFLGWRVSLWLFPDRACRACRGTGVHRWGRLRRTCNTCASTGRVPRVGARRR